MLRHEPYIPNYVYYKKKKEKKKQIRNPQLKQHTHITKSCLQYQKKKKNKQK